MVRSPAGAGNCHGVLVATNAPGQIPLPQGLEEPPVSVLAVVAP